MTIISWYISGVPVPKGRPKFVARGKFATAYTPIKTRRYEKQVALQSALHAPKKPFSGPISVTLIFRMPRPKSLPKRVIEHIRRPDLDNLIKSVLDPLNKIFYKDDSQIVHLDAKKVYTTEEPGVVVVISDRLDD